MLIDDIKDAALVARKARETIRATLLTTLYAEAAIIGKNAGREVTDDEVNKVIKKFLKNAEITYKARPNLDIEYEMEILKEFLPEATDHLLLAIDVSFESIAELVDNLIKENPGQFESLHTKPQNIGWFVGQTMKHTGGKANPVLVKEYILGKL